MKTSSLVFALCALGGCTSVRMVQRDGCWLKQTSHGLGGTSEELGFCERPAPPPAEDRLARLVQECMAQADYRWENRAISAWSRNEPIPPQEPDAQITRICMEQAAAAMGVQAENESLKARIAELGQDRDSLKAMADKDREYLQASSDKMITALGDAAKRPAPNATATATSTGTAQTKSDTSAQPPPATVVTMPPRPQRAPAAACHPAKVAAERRCEKVAEEAPHGG